MKFNIKKFVVCFMMLFFVASFAVAETSSVSDTDIAKILEDLDGLMKNCKDNSINKVFKFVKAKIESGEVSVVRDKKTPKESFEVAEFSFSAKYDSPTIHIYPAAIELYEKFPSVTFSSIIYTYKQCYDFYNSKLFHFVNKNKLEKFLFEMDAHYLQGGFISAVLVPQEILPNAYLDHFYKSFAENNLHNYAVAFQTVNLNQLFGYVTFARENKSDIAAEAFAKDGKDILENLKVTDKDDKWQIYQKALVYKTYIEFMPDLVLYAKYFHGGEIMTQKDINFKKDYPEIYDNIKQLKKLYKKHSKVVKSMHQELVEKFAY
ncbi:MAG: hypothetical protein CR988_04490 [Treponema sp.]|nr:MAG: hypothetical protein CR988_04490 [Treponema sp.]